MTAKIVPNLSHFLKHMEIHLASTVNRIAGDMISPLSKPHFFFYLETSLAYAHFLFETF
jgi:hypothetical protein